MRLQPIPDSSALITRFRQHNPSIGQIQLQFVANDGVENIRGYKSRISYPAMDWGQPLEMVVVQLHFALHNMHAWQKGVLEVIFLDEPDEYTEALCIDLVENIRAQIASSLHGAEGTW